MTNPKLINFLLFQTGWFACVLAATNHVATIGLMVALIVILIHIYLSHFKTEEAILIAIITTIGYSWDSTLVLFGVFAYEDSEFTSFAPLWIAAMWGMFATTLNSSLAWLQDRIITASLLGAVFGPIAYYSASKLGAVSLLLEPNALFLQAFAWATFMPIMLLLSRMGYRKNQQPNMEQSQ